MPNYQHDLRHFIVEKFLFGRQDDPFSDDDSFLKLGIIDSTGVLELVSFLQQQYHITIEDEELIPDNLDSIERLVRFVTRKAEKAA